MDLVLSKLLSMTSVYSRAFSVDAELVAQDDAAEEEWS